MKKEEIEEKRKKEMIRQLRKGPDLEAFLEGRKHGMVRSEYAMYCIIS